MPKGLFPTIAAVLLAAAFATSTRADEAAPSVCAFTLDTEFLHIGPASNGGVIELTAPASCAWTAFGTEHWLQVLGNGVGSGAVEWTVGPNYFHPTRQARIIVIGADGEKAKVPFKQDTCHYRVDPPRLLFPAEGGSGEVLIDTSDECIWTLAPRREAPWVHFPEVVPDAGPFMLAVSVHALDPGVQRRVATFTIGDKKLRIVQR